MNTALLVIFFSLAGLGQSLPPAPAQEPAATVDAIREVANARRWDDLETRLQAVGPDDAAWLKLSQVVYQAGITRQDLPWAIGRLTRVASATTTPSIKAAALIAIGRAHRRQGDAAAATRTLETARAAVPGSDYAEEAGGLIYEIAHLSPGMPAPAISAKARNGRAISLEALRGKPVVLVFWGST